VTDLWPAPTCDNAISKVIEIPGSKSLTNRWLLLASIAATPSRINLPLRARDTELMANAIRSLGSSVEVDGEDWVVTPGELTGSTEIDCGLAGTVMRFVPPVAVLANGSVRFDGDPRARVRPMSAIISALRDLGAQISDDDRGTLPFTIFGKGFLPGGEVSLDASSSSQFISALLLAGARYDQGITVTHSGGVLPSLPHIEMTISALAHAGIAVAQNLIDARNATWRVSPQVPQGFSITVEPDLSNAAAFVAAALVTNGSVTIKNWPEKTTQAGNALVELIPAMGGAIQRIGSDLKFTGTGKISGLDADLHEVGELTPVIAALCALAESPSQLRGIGHLRGHETDRLAALTNEINKLGGQVTETEDGLSINPKQLHGGIFETYEDHRMAMAGAVLGLRVKDLRIENIDTTSKTLPEFASMWLEMVTT
jgi:3-phosphoshikimate 1-carboxyvinyltransferase